jgi:transposase
MRKIIEILRLHAAGHSQERIGRSCGLGRSTVGDYLARARQAGLSWPLPEPLSETEVEQQLFPASARTRPPSTPNPDWAKLHRELRRPGVTLELLWQEYREGHPQGYSYSWFCARYRTWAGQTDVVMRQVHRAGEKLFVDYAGHTVAIVDRHSGERHQAQIFVAVLGASNYTFAEATWSQQLPDWLQSHVRAFAFFGGVPEIVVPDNLKAGVAKAHRYEPEINRSYAELAAHYRVAVIPARARRPRDKAKVEVGVQVVERWILARLREQTFFSLDALNHGIAQFLATLNARPFKKLDGSRRHWFEQLDRPALRPLPANRYVFAQWRKARVNIDYHIELDRHYYSVPYQLVRQEVEVRLTAQTVEVFYRSKAVAYHRRAAQVGQHTTVAAHMPRSHREYAEWTPQRLIRWAHKVGPYSAQLVEQILAARAHPSRGYRSCLGILRLGKSYGDQRLEAACRRALVIGGLSYKSVESILKRKLDQQPLPVAESSTESLPAHSNIRGSDYYH